MDIRLTIALGIEDHLDDFAFMVSAVTWKRLVLANPSDWSFEFLRYLSDDSVRFSFNLTGVNVESGVALAASGNPRTFRWTDWELLKIKQRPSSWYRISWWRDGGEVANPFEPT